MNILRYILFRYSHICMFVYFLFCLLLFCIVHHEYDHERA